MEKTHKPVAPPWTHRLLLWPSALVGPLLLACFCCLLWSFLRYGLPHGTCGASHTRHAVQVPLLGFCTSFFQYLSHHQENLPSLASGVVKAKAAMLLWHCAQVAELLCGQCGVLCKTLCCPAQGVLAQWLGCALQAATVLSSVLWCCQLQRLYILSACDPALLSCEYCYRVSRGSA